MAKVAIPRQDPIEVYINEDDEVVIKQECAGETEHVVLSRQNVDSLIAALEEVKGE
jgi:hypothetical protein